jgi:TonB-linked SusC/RagA family outer membrane protein
MKTFICLTILFLPFFLGKNNLFAQKNTINGHVTDAATGNPVKKVRIILPLAGKKILTDENGKFKTGINKKMKNIVLRKFGYDDLTFPAKEGNLDFALKRPEIYFDSLSGGLHQHKKLRYECFAVEKIDFSPTLSFENNLRKNSNAMIFAAPKTGNAPFLNVRGAASIVPDNRPLLLLDGMPVLSENLAGYPSSISFFVGLHPADFSSVSLSKSASAFFGARGANGALLFSTKTGYNGKTIFELNLSSGIISPAAKPQKSLGRAEFLKYADEIYENRKKIDPNFTLGKEEAFASVFGNIDNQADNDFSSAAFRSGFTTDLHLSARGGNDKNIFYASVFGQKTKNALVGNQSDNAGFMLNTESKFSEKLRFGFTQRVSFAKIDRAAADTSLSNPILSAANAPFYAQDAASKFPFVNPKTESENGFLRDNILRSVSKISARYVFNENLTWRNEFSAEIFKTEEDEFRGRKTAAGESSEGWARNAVFSQNNLVFQSLADYQKQVGETVLNVTGGFSVQKVKFSGASLTGFGFPADDFTQASGASALLGAESVQNAYLYRSAFVSANLVWKEKYIFRADARFDSHSKAGENKFSDFFPQIGAAWLLSKEFSDSSAIMPLLKIRADYGISGNGNLTPYASRGLYAGNRYGNFAGIYSKYLANPDLANEKTSQANAGVDFALLYGYIFGSFNYFLKNTDKLILPISLPPSSGFEGFLSNQGNVKSSGYELNLNWQMPLGEIIWTSGILISSVKSVMGNMNGNVIETGLYGFAKNADFAAFYLPEFIGVNPQNGDALYRSKDGSTNDILKAEKYFHASALPTSRQSWTNSILFKNIRFEIAIDAASGHKVYEGGRAAFFAAPTSGDFAKMWRTSGENTDIPQQRWGLENGNAPSSRFLKDGSFVRLRNISISWRFPEELLSKFRISKASVFVSAENLTVLSGYKGGEILNDLNTNFSVGNASIAPPQMRSFSAGLSVGF